MLKQPESMEELVYFTRRVLEPKGKAMAWVFREQCPKCKKSLMGKPVEKGKIKIRAPEYICPSCKYAVEKEEYEDTLTCNVSYTCPHCAKEGEVSVPFKRKTFQGVKAVVFECGKCKEKIAITKKMKAPKKGKAPKGIDLDE